MFFSIVTNNFGLNLHFWDFSPALTAHIGLKSMSFALNCAQPNVYAYATRTVFFFFFFNRCGEAFRPPTTIWQPPTGVVICHPNGVAFTLRLFFRVASVVQPSASLPAPYAPLRGATPNPFGVRCNAHIRVCVQFWPVSSRFQSFFAAGFIDTPLRGPSAENIWKSVIEAKIVA